MNLLWLDIETTGLNPMKHDILEIGMAVTDKDLHVLDTLNIVMAQPEDVLERMDQWCWETHSKSGLLKEVRASDKTMFDAKILISVFLTVNFPSTKPVLHGNSVHFDKKFIDLHMPEISEMLHYRLVDVSSIKEALKSFGYRHIPSKISASEHRSILDIGGSIEEFKSYRDIFSYGLKMQGLI